MSLTDKAHQIISKKFSVINVGIDATCGNGHDTVFLAKLCSNLGKVLSFDIQKKALEIAEKEISNSGLLEKVIFINDGHENMSKYIDQKADVIMFNLGYLPNSEKKISTKTETTISALNLASELLTDNGLISIICYPGHTDGKRETEKVKEWLNDLDQKQFKMSEYLSEKVNNSTPFLFILEKV